MTNFSCNYKAPYDKAKIRFLQPIDLTRLIILIIEHRMPRPRVNKKEKISFSSSAINNGSFNDEVNCLKTFIGSKIVRSKKGDGNSLIDENFLLGSSLNNASYETNNTRVVINPAVLRYLEHNRHCNKNKLTVDQDDDHNINSDIFVPFLLSSNLSDDDPSHMKNVHRKSRTMDAFKCTSPTQNELFWNFSLCSTDFLPSAQLAEWILMNPDRARFQSFIPVHFDQNIDTESDVDVDRGE